MRRRKGDDDDCKPNRETINAVAARGVGCSKDEALNNLLADLLDKAEQDRKVKCGDLKCKGLEGGTCQTTIDPDDTDRITGSVKYHPIKRSGCPGGVGWLATVALNPPRFVSECQCVPDAV
jgi:hypothetical protein